VNGNAKQELDSQIVDAKEAARDALDPAKKVPFVCSEVKYVGAVNACSHAKEELHVFLSGVFEKSQEKEEGEVVMVSTRRSDRFSRELHTYMTIAAMMTVCNVTMASHSDESENAVVARVASQEMAKARSAERRSEDGESASRFTKQRRLEDLREDKKAVLPGNEHAKRVANQRLTALVDKRSEDWRKAGPASRKGIEMSILKEAKDENLVLHEHIKDDNVYVEASEDKKRKQVNNRLVNKAKRKEAAMVKPALKGNKVTKNLLESLHQKPVSYTHLRAHET